MLPPDCIWRSMKNQMAPSRTKGPMLNSSGRRMLFCGSLIENRNLRRIELVEQGVGARRERGVELILRVLFRWPCSSVPWIVTSCTWPRADLVEQIGVGDFRVFASHVGAALDNSPTAASGR